MFEKLLPRYIIPHNDELVKTKFDFVKNLTIGPGQNYPANPDRIGPGALDDNIIIATYLTIKKGM